MRFHPSQKPPRLRLELSDGVISSGELPDPLDGIEQIHDNEFSLLRNLAAQHITAGYPEIFCNPAEPCR